MMALPERLGRYRILKELGQGGMGVVYEASSEDASDQLVALKVLQALGGTERRAKRRFLDEARIGALLHHVNIVRTLDLGMEGEEPFIVMERLNGAPLSALAPLPGEKLPVGLVVAIGLQALAGLHHAHEARGPEGAPLGLVHRDLKHSNLFLTELGEIKLIDFGIAVAYLESTRTHTGRTGSLPYLAPEQINEGPIDRRSDIYSLALVLFELLAGRRLFNQSNDGSMLNAILWSPAPSLREFRSDTPEALNTAVGLALKKNPEERPGDAARFAELLRESVAPEEIWSNEQIGEWVRAGIISGAAHTRTGTIPRPPVGPPAAEMSPWIRRPRNVAMASGAALLILAFSIAAWRVAGRDTRVDVPPPAITAPPVPKEEPIAPEVPIITAKEPPPKRASETRRLKRSVQREARPASITIDARPGWARVLLDGREVGTTPIFRYALPHGRHRVEAIRSDGKRQRRAINLAEGDEQKLLFEF